MPQKEETNLQNSIRKELTKKMPSVRLFRNNVGVGYRGTVVKENPPVITLRNYYMIRFGLAVGSSDLIGWKSIVVTPEMVGKKVAIFCSLEVKTDDGVVDDEQINWIDQVRKAGGIAGVVRSVDDAVRLLETGSSGQVQLS